MSIAFLIFYPVNVFTYYGIYLLTIIALPFVALKTTLFTWSKS